MKKVLFAFNLCLCFAGPLFAGPIGFGIEGGVNMANQVDGDWSNPQTTSPDVIFGFNGGVFAEFGLDDSLSLRPEIEYTRKGVQLTLHHIIVTGPTPDYTYTDATYTDTYNYLEIPVLLKAATNLGPGIKGSLSVGPEFSFLLDYNEYFSIAFDGLTGSSQPSFVSNFEAGAVFGAGIELEPILLDLRYDRGLTSVYTVGPAVTNSVLALEVGYRIE